MPPKQAVLTRLAPCLLREGAPILSRPFSLIFNRSLQQGYFPQGWKDANVTPIHKKDEKRIPGNYRPISLLSQLGKTTERCVHKHLYNYVVSNQILTPLQSGFVRDDSTTYQLIHTYHQFCQAVDSVKEVRAFFFAISVRHLTGCGTDVKHRFYFYNIRDVFRIEGMLKVLFFGHECTFWIKPIN